MLVLNVQLCADLSCDYANAIMGVINTLLSVLFFIIP